MKESNHSLMLPSTYSQIIARTLNIQARQMEQILFGTLLSSDVLLPGDLTYITVKQQIQIIDNAIRISGVDNLGLKLGQQLHPSVHGPLGYLVLSSPNLRTALSAFADFISVRFPFSELDIREKDRNLVCTMILKTQVNHDIARLLQECFALMMQAIVEAIIGRTFKEGTIQFEYGQPHYISQYSQYLHCQYAFGAPSTALFVPLRLLNISNVSGDTRSHALALTQCQQLLQQIPKINQSTADQVRSYVLSTPIGTLSEDDVAKVFFVSKRTLARRLEQEQTSYRQIIESLMSELAVRHLSDKSLSVETIAFMMGYGDSAAFRKAFRRWYKQTPSQYRNTIE